MPNLTVAGWLAAGWLLLSAFALGVLIVVYAAERAGWRQSRADPPAEAPALRSIAGSR